MSFPSRGISTPASITLHTALIIPKLMLKSVSTHPQPRSAAALWLQKDNFLLDERRVEWYSNSVGGYVMNSHKTNELYEKFPHLYRERTAPLDSSQMPWGFQCEDGWYKILYDMSKKIEKISSEGEFAPAISLVSKHEDGTLHVAVRNIMPPVADIVTRATEQSRLTCEFCSYSPAFLRGAPHNLEGHIACGRCAGKASTTTRNKSSKRKRKPLRPPDTIIVKRQ